MDESRQTQGPPVRPACRPDARIRGTYQEGYNHSKAAKAPVQPRPTSQDTGIVPERRELQGTLA